MLDLLKEMFRTANKQKRKKERKEEEKKKSPH